MDLAKCFLITGMILALCADNGRADDMEIIALEPDGVAALPEALPDMTKSMVEVRVSQIEADRFLPWRNSVPRWQDGYAIAVRPGLFLVPEELVRNHAAIQLRRAGSLRPVPGEVVHADDRVGLAIIRATEPDWFSDAVPLSLLHEIPQNGDFTLLQWGANDHLQVGVGNLLSIGFESVGEGIPPQLTYELASSMRIDHPGTPILHEGELAGLAMRFRGGRRTAVVLSPDNITRFLEASEYADYAGIPEPDFEFKPLANPVRRRFLGVPESLAEDGILVRAVFPHTDKDHGLQIDDVILSWDGHALDARGNYQHEIYGRIPFRHLLSQRSPGDHVPVQVIRDKTIQDVYVVMQTNDTFHRRIPRNETGQPDDYVIAAGLIFRELTVDFLKAFGERWERRGEIDLIWHAYTHSDQPEDAFKRTVMLVGVLADPINIGYRELRYRIVTQVNGEPIRNLADLAQKLEQDGFSGVTFAGMEAAPLRFVPAEVEEANPRIQARFQIPALSRLTEQPEESSSR